MKHSSHTESRSRCCVTFVVLLVAFWSKPFLQVPLKVFTQSSRKDKGLKAIFNSFFLVFTLFDLISRDIVEICRYLIISVPGIWSDQACKRLKLQPTLFLGESAEEYFRPRRSVLLRSSCLLHQVRGIVDFLSLLLSRRSTCDS